MNNKKVRPVSILIALIFIVTMLGGCSGNGSTASNKDNGGTAPEKKVEEQSSRKEATLTFYFPGQAKADTRKVLDEIEKQTKSTLNVKLDFKWLNNDYSTEIFKLLSSNEPIDAYSSSVMSDYQFILYDYGKIKDIKELIPRYAPKLFSQFETGDLQSVTFDGKIGFLPNLYPLTNSVYAVVREDLCVKYGIREIKTFEDYEVYLKKIKENESGITPGIFANGFGAGSKMRLFQPSTDYSVVDPGSELVCRREGSSLKVVAWEQTPEFKKMIELFTGWQAKQYFPPNELAADWWGSIYGWFAKGKISSTIVSENDVGYPMELLAEAANELLQASSGKGFALKAYRLYPGKETQIIRAVDRTGYNHLAFANNSKNTGRALEFVNWVMSDKKNYDLFMYGIEGEHYVAKGDSEYAMPEGVKRETNRYLGWSGSEAFRNAKFERYAIANEAYDRKSFIEKNTKYSPCTGFYPVFKDIADLSNKRMEYSGNIEANLSIGKLNPNGVEALINDMKNAGSDKVVEEIQKQIDKWLKSK